MTDLPPELLPQGPQPQGPQGPAKPPSPDAELANEFGAMLAEDAQGQDEQLQEDFQWFMQTSYEDSMRAKGFGENVKFGAASVGKSFGDGVSSLLGFAFKSGSSIAAGLSGDGFGHGWDVGAKGLEQGTGSTDPGVVDLSVAIGDIMGLSEREEGVNYGAQADADLRLRLGRAALATETAGFLASFAIGPGAAVGRGGARAVDVIGSPVAKLMAKPAERAIAKMATTSAKAAQEMIDSGKAWQVLTSTDKWKKSVSMTERSMAWGGRTFQDMLSMTGANVAQSYAMAKDDERMAHLATAAWTSPFMVPISRIGQKIGGLVATKGMKRPDAEWLQDAMAKIESGKMTVPQLHKKLWKHSNPAMRAAGNMIASSVEGSMFLGLDPHAWELFAKYRAGDMDALADLQAMALGSITGLAVVKGVTPVDLAPMFKRLAPEFNTLSSHIEAETNRRSANDETLNSAVAKVAKDAVPPQEPRGGSAAGQQFGVKVTKGLTQKDQRTLLADKQRRDQADADLWKSAEMAGPTGEMARKMAAVEQDTRAKFGWAEEATTGLLRGGWEPSFSTDGSGDVHLSFGRDHNLTLTQDAGDVSLVLSPEHVQMLRDVDGLPGDPTVESPNRQRLTGDAAREALHNLSLLSVVRQQEFALNAERIGMDEVMPGVYATPGEGIHHYVQLDGSIVQRSAVDGAWIPGKSDMQVVGQPGEATWNHPNADLLADTLIAKRAMSPDLLVDNALSQSIALARYGRGASADELRAFLETLTPEQIQQAMTPAADDFLAFDLGSLGSGTNNAHNLMMERHSKSLDRQMGGEEAAAEGLGSADPAVPHQEFTRAMEGKDTYTAEGLQKSLSKRLQGVRDAEHDAYREALTEASDAEAAKHTEAATKKARWEGIQEEIHRRIFPEKQAKLEPDPIPQDKVHGGIPVDDVKGLARSVGKGVGKTVDFIARDMADVLQRKGVEFGPRLKKVRSKAGEIEGRALEHSAKLQELQKDPTHKAEFTKLLGEYHPIGKSETMQRSRFEDLINGRVEPETPLERIVVEEGQAFTGSLRDAASDAGSFRAKKDKDGNTYHEPVVKGGKTSTPYVEGRDMHKVMESPKLRKAFFDELAQHNELYRDGRRLTGDDLVDDWVKREKPSGESTNAKKKAAVEFSRKFHNYPEVWKHEGKTYEIQEANPWNRHHRIAQQESGRAAMDAEFGVGGGDMDAKALRTKGQAEGWEKQHLDALEKGGLQAEIDRTHEHHLRHSDKAEADSIRDAMDLLAARAQGAEIVDGLVKNPGASRFWAGLQALRSSALSSLSFLRDIPDLARGAQFTGARRLFKATAALAGDTKEFTRILERDGVLMRQMGDWIYQEARGLFRGTADRIGWAAQKTERAKAILAAKQVELMINDVNAGKGTDMDSYFIESLLGIDVAGQKIEGDLRVQVMREGTEFLTSRARKGSYSKFADDPRTSQLLLFQRFATKRLESHIKVYENVFATAKEHGWMSKRNVSALKTAVKTALGVSVAGVMGDWLIESVIGLVTEGNGDGFHQFMNEATATPEAMFAQWGESVKNQMVGGPAASITRMFDEPDKVKTWTDLTSVGAMAHALVTMAVQAGEGDSYAGVHLMENAGFIPARRVLAGWARATVMGKDPAVRRASLQVWNWRRENDLMPASGGSKTRPEEFYDAVGSSIRSLVNNGLDSDKALLEASEKVREALSLAPAESVAASIRGHRMVANLTPQQRGDLFAAINDDERVKQILQFDEALSDMARSVARMEGTAPSDFEATMKLVAEQAALGSSDQWREVAEMAVDASVADLEAGGRGDAEIRELSRHLAMYPEHLDNVFTGRQLVAIQRRENSLARADMIWRLLYRRARSNHRDSRRGGRK